MRKKNVGRFQGFSIAYSLRIRSKNKLFTNLNIFNLTNSSIKLFLVNINESKHDISRR